VRSGSEEYTQYSATAAETTAQVISDDQDLQRNRLQATINQLAPGSGARTKAEREMSDLNVKINGQFGNFVDRLSSGAGTSSGQPASATQAPSSSASDTASIPISTWGHPVSQSASQQTAASPRPTEQIKPKSKSSNGPGSTKSSSGAKTGAAPSADQDSLQPAVIPMANLLIGQPGQPENLSETMADAGFHKWKGNFQPVPRR